MRFLQHNPLCIMCKQAGRITPAAVVDHRTPHRGDQTLFWDESNWQALCAHHHNSHKQSAERTGYSTEVGTDGWPTDERHPANKESH